MEARLLSTGLCIVFWSLMLAFVTANAVLEIGCREQGIDPGFEIHRSSIRGPRQDFEIGEFQPFEACHQTFRGYNNFRYKLSRLPNGPATLTLEFAEYNQTICSIGDGGRVFSVEVDDTVVLANFDTFVAGGRICGTLVAREFPVVISGGEIDLNFIRGVGDTMISGIKVARDVDVDATTVRSDRPPVIVAGTRTTDAPTASTTPTTNVTPRTTTPVLDDGCDGLGNIVRKNVKSMTQKEWDDYVTAFRIVASTHEPGGSGRSIYEQFSRDHTLYSFHENTYFLAWHREMLWKMDVALNAAVPGVTQPYFDWSVSADNIFADPMFRADRFGGGVNQTGDSLNHIPDGAWRGLQSSWPVPHAVTRRFTNDPLATSRLIDAVVARINTFDDFSTAVEYGVHNAFHRAIGSDMVTPWSPNDPIFYFHHAFIDLIYRRWENRFSEDTSWRVNPEQQMAPWKENALESTRGSAKRCVFYEGLSSSSARYAVLSRHSEQETTIEFEEETVVFETASEKVEALEIVAQKKVADPDGYKREADRWRKARAAAEDAAKLMNRDLSKLYTAENIIATLLLKEGVVDMTEVDKVANESVAEVKAEGIQTLLELSCGSLPEYVSTADVANMYA